jgi:gluconate:H+ symporter, GntP family
MPVYHAALLGLAVAVLVYLIQSLRLHPFLAILGVAFGYGIAADMSFAYIGQSIGSGFAQTIENAGLVILTGAIIAALVERSGVAAGLAARFARAGGSQGIAWLAPLGFVAGIAVSPTASFAILTPILSGFAKAGARATALPPVGLALALLASHGAVFPAAGLVAAVAILGADPILTVAIGIPAALVSAAVGLGFAAGLAQSWERAGAERPTPAAAAADPPHRSAHAIALILPVGLMLGLLLLQSIGQWPSEPLGGARTREFLIGLGRPAIVMAAGLGLTVLLMRRAGEAVFGERGWVGEAIIGATGLLLITGASGAFAKILQNTGMPELLAERLLDARIGVLLPFTVAALLKTLQGSSLVAAITAAGMVQPLLGALGLESELGRALAAVAVGTGAVAITHVNDSFFWLVTGVARLKPGRGLALLSVGSALQALAALAFLLIVTTLAR